MMSEFKVEKYMIAGGNETALVRGGQAKDYLQISQDLLATGVEQVGFVEENDDQNNPKLVMMGGELCVNAMLALAFSLPNPIGVIRVPKDRPLEQTSYRQYENMTGVSISMSWVRKKSALPNGQIVLFFDMGYMTGLTVKEAERLKDSLPALCDQFKKPAFGLIAQNADRIIPIVYVKATDSTVYETACGSGSIATYIAMNEGFGKESADIVQPTGQSIQVRGWTNHRTPGFSVSAMVERIQ